VRLSLATLLAVLGADAPAADVARSLVDLCSPVLRNAGTEATTTGRRRLGGGSRRPAGGASQVLAAVRETLRDAEVAPRLNLDSLSVPHVALDALRALAEDDMGEGPDVLREQDLLAPLAHNVASDVDLLGRRGGGAAAAAMQGSERTQRLRVLQQRLQVLQSAAFQNTDNQDALVRLDDGLLLRTLQRCVGRVGPA